MYSAITAIVGGVLIAVAAFVPWAAVQYRRRGSLHLGDALIATATVVYGLAIITYTLLPLPADPETLCATRNVTPQLRPFAFLHDIERAGGTSGPASLLRNAAAAQVFFNVVLFVPLGMLVRHRLRRNGLAAGIAVATAVGAAMSLLVECTQLTGDWFAYPCAYRLFDIDDLIANTLGAFVGAFLAPLLRPLAGAAPSAPGRPRPVTVTRRLLGMLCDFVAVMLTSFACTAALVMFLAVTGVDRNEPHVNVAGMLLACLAAAGQLVLVLATGRTLGEIVVRLRPVPPSPGMLRRLARWVAGIGGWYLVMTLVEVRGAEVLTLVWAAVAVICVWTTRGRRGFAYAVAGFAVEDDRVHDPQPEVVAMTRSRTGA